MAEERYTIRQEIDTEARAARLRLIGRFDRAACTSLQRALFRVLTQERPISVLVDADEAMFIGGECAKVLLAGYTKALRAGHGYQVVEAHGHIRHVLETVGLCPRTDIDGAIYSLSFADAIEDMLRFTAAAGDEVGPEESQESTVGGQPVGRLAHRDVFVS